MSKRSRGDEPQRNDPSRWRKPRTPRPIPALIRPEDVGGDPAWQELLARRAIVVVRGELAVPSTVTIDAATRARALAAYVTPHSAICGLSAAWVLGAGRTPDVVEVAFPGRRHSPPAHPGRIARQARMLADELVTFDAVRVTGPLRTVIDIATYAPLQEAIEVGGALCIQYGVHPSVAIRSIRLRYRWPHRDRAENVLATVLRNGFAATRPSSALPLDPDHRTP